jgi:hypothetical protein
MIDVVSRVFPQFLKALSAEVFPAYSELAAEGGLAKAGYDFQKALCSDNPQLRPFDVLTEDGDIRPALLRWAERFNASAPWLIDSALRTLDDWHRAPDWRAQLRWESFNVRSGRAVVGEPFGFANRGWDIRSETWADFNKSLRSRFEVQLRAYEERIRQLAESGGLELAQKKYSPANLKWFVLYQFAGLSSTQIANKCTRSGRVLEDSTILKGVKAARDLIEWGQLRRQKSRAGKLVTDLIFLMFIEVFRL